MDMAVKLLSAPAHRVGGYLVVWGNPHQKDLQGDYFTPQSDLGLAWYPERPMLYHHGQDESLADPLIGKIDRLEADEVGVWAEAQLDAHHRHYAAIKRLIEAGALSWSSGSLPHLVERQRDGWLKRWVIVEGSLTPTPAEPRLTDVTTLKSAYHAIGQDPSRWLSLPQAQQDEEEKNPMQENTSYPLKRLPVADARDALRVQVTSEYDRLNAQDMLYGYLMLRAGKGFHGVSERYANALAHKVRQASLTAIKSDELAYSTQTAYGDEWVAELWSDQVWQAARAENVVLPLFKQLEMPSNPFDLPIDGTAPSVYYVPETKDEAHLTLGAGNPIPDSKIGTGKVTLNAKKLALRVGFSSELVEDSIVNVLSVYRERAVRAIADAMDNALLNGDTTTSATGNINSDHAAPTANSVFLAFDGLRKLALVTATGNAVDMGNAAPTLAKLREARFAMAYRYSARPNDLAWLVDGGTYAKLLNVAEFVTMDKAGALATAQTGQIGFIDGIPVFVSSEMPLTEADGKVGGGTNNRGSAVCVYRNGWFVGYRRKIAVSVDYLPYTDSYQLTATVRLALARFDSDVASVLYNVAV
jgi:HK97 family phage major capsid protein